MTVVNRLIPAASHGGTMAGPPTLLVVHSCECPLKAGYAVSIATNWFARSAPTSAHYIVDPSTVVQMLPDNVIGWHCGTGNRRSLGFEQAGYARFTRAEWTTPDGLAQLDRLAGLLAEKVRKFGIPVRWATDDQIRAGHSGGPGGITTHRDIARVLGGSTHTDPEPNYPRDLLLAAVRGYVLGKPVIPALPTPPPPQESIMVGLSSADETVLRHAVGGGVMDALRTEEGRHLIATAVQDALNADRLQQAQADADAAEKV